MSEISKGGDCVNVGGGCQGRLTVPPRQFVRVLAGEEPELVQALERGTLHRRGLDAGQSGDRPCRQGAGPSELGVDAPANGAENGEVPGGQLEAEHVRTVGPAGCLA